MKFLYMFIPSLYILGDVGYYTDSLQSLVNNFSKNITGDNRLILMGDNFYNEGIKEKNDKQWNDYTKVFSKIPYNKITAIIGNHDFTQIGVCYVVNTQSRDLQMAQPS